ncbi:AP endonuclease, family 2 domain protein [Caballeronia concitans]|jgi:sugar phosphate isomerase/epimerase|uniref:AP endonuclease, family 2 domain protein n=1 Tax=Caballeronia concitans TaxID=1777133 RepID=A0A658R0S2_9BURK|nr:AP endonuclease, family 2 domain protein [Caballeronia concitans]
MASNRRSTQLIRRTPARASSDPHNDAFFGVAVNVYHCWWDPQLDEALTSIGNDNRIVADHVSDWMVRTTDSSLDGGMMGDGVIALKGLPAKC